MKALFYVGSIAVGVIFLVYQLYKQREQEQGYQHGSAHNYSDNEDYIEIMSSMPNETNLVMDGKVKTPGPEEKCAICLDDLIRKDSIKKYCIIALPKCGHWFHQKCALRLLEYHPMCPVCRVGIDSSMLKSTPVRLISTAETEPKEPEPELVPSPSPSSSSTTATTTSHPTPSTSRGEVTRRKPSQNSLDLD